MAALSEAGDDQQPGMTAWLAPHPLGSGREEDDNNVYALGVGKGLVVDNLTRFRDAKDNNLSTFEDVVLGADGGGADDAATDPLAHASVAVGTTSRKARRPS